MKIRTGRDNPRVLYLQLGDEPAKGSDVCLGLIMDSQVAALIALRLSQDDAATIAKVVGE